MGFSGGGSNILKAHRHDGLVVQDGGSLDFNNITQSNSSAGEVFFSDGTHLQQLAYPGTPAGETLTAAAASTSPTWVAGATPSSVLSLIDHTVAPASTTTIDTTFTNIPATDMSELYCLTSGSNGGYDVGMQVYDQDGALLTGANYRYAGLLTVNGVQTIINQTAATDFLAASGSIGPHTSVIHLSLGGNGDFIKFQVNSYGGAAGGGGNAYQTLGGYYNAGGMTGIAGLKLGTSVNESIEISTSFTIYKRSNS